MHRYAIALPLLTSASQARLTSGQSAALVMLVLTKRGFPLAEFAHQKKDPSIDALRLINVIRARPGEGELPKDTKADLLDVSDSSQNMVLGESFGPHWVKQLSMKSLAAAWSRLFETWTKLVVEVVSRKGSWDEENSSSKPRSQRISHIGRTGLPRCFLGTWSSLCWLIH
jgi:hypothetical protein